MKKFRIKCMLYKKCWAPSLGVGGRLCSESVPARTSNYKPFLPYIILSSSQHSHQKSIQIYWSRFIRQTAFTRSNGIHRSWFIHWTRANTDLITNNNLCIHILCAVRSFICIRFVLQVCELQLVKSYIFAYVNGMCV